MGYVGTAPLSGDYRKLDDISGSFNGSTTDFTLQVGSANVTPPRETTMIISVGGILQEPITAYTVAGSTLTFTAAPASGADFFGILLGDTMDIGTPSDDTVTGAKIVDDAIDSEHYTDGSIDTAHLADDAVTSAKIADDAVVTAAIADDAITSALIADDAITSALIADDAVVSAAIADNAITNALMADDAIDSDEIAAGAIDTAHIADDQVTLAKMAGLARGKIIYGDSSGNPAALASGSTGQVLKMTDGNDFAWAAGASTTQDFTASGTISTGDLVSLNSNGTVSTSTSPIASEIVDFESAGITYTSTCYDVDANRVVIAYTDSANSSYGTAIVGTISGNAITFGTPVVFESASTTSSAVYDTNVDKVVIAYSDHGNSSYGTVIVGDVSGTSISFGSPVVFESANSVRVSASFDSNSNKVVIAYVDGGNSNYGTACTATAAADNSVTVGTPAVFESAATTLGELMDIICFDPDTNQHIICYRDGGNSNHGTAVVAAISGTNMTYGTPVVFEAAAVNNNGIAYDTNSNKVVISYRDVGDSSNGKAIVGTVSGTAISFGTASTAYDPNNSGYFHQIYFDPSVNKLMAIWENYISTPSINFGTAVMGTISGTDITWDTDNAFYFNRGTTSYMSSVYDPDSGFMVIAFQDGSDANHGKCVLADTSASNNFLNWLGIAQTGVSDGATVKVNLLGTINENQSSLTVGTKYYVGHTGALQTTAIDNRQVGIATATTKLFITAGSIS